MDKISYKLPVFEGPMDLLLHLINKHKLNIYDIPILELVEQYVAAVRQMQEDENLEVTSEFLEMAARLVYLKTVSLLPVHEEADQLKKELTGELLEYRDCQLMAQKLAEHTDGFDHYTREPQVFEVDPPTRAYMNRMSCCALIFLLSERGSEGCLLRWSRLPELFPIKLYLWVPKSPSSCAG